MENMRRDKLYCSVEDFKSKCQRNQKKQESKSNDDGIIIEFNPNAFLGLEGMSELDVALLGDKHPLYRLV